MVERRGGVELGATKILGIIVMVLSVPLLLGGVLFMFSTNPPMDPFVQDDATKTGYALVAAGVLFLLLGLILLLIGPRTKVLKGAAEAAPQPQQIEIKRTEMNLGGQQAASPSEQLQEALDDINRKIGQAKVQYGMGQLSNESYKLLTSQYEKEKGAIEAEIIRQRG